MFIYTGCPKIMENGGFLKSHSLFQTGFRKSIALKQSSLSKASSVLSYDGDAIVDTGSRISPLLQIL